MARITVKLSDGRVGTIDEQEFDPKSMSQFQAPQQQAPKAPEKSILQGNLGGDKLVSGDNPLSNILNALASPFVKLGQAVPKTQNDLAQYQQTLPDAKGNLPQALKNALNLTGRFAKDTIANPDVLKNETAAATTFVNPVANSLKGTLAKGALIGAGQSLPQAQNAEDVLGGATGGATGNAILGKLLPTIGSKVIGGLLKKTGGAIEGQAVQKTLQASPSVARNAIEDHGLDINKIYKKNFGQETNYDTLLGDASARGGGGLFGEKINAAEQAIKSEIKGAGSTIRFSADKLTKAIEKEKATLKKTIGNDEKITAIDQLLTDTQERFKNGASASQLLALKRAADSKFGKAVTETDKGSVTTSVQKSLGNVSRGLLKSRFKNIKDALDTETELYTLKPILNSARGSENVSGKGKIGLGDIGALSPILFGNPLAAGAAFAGKKAIESPALLNKAGGALQSTGKGIQQISDNPMLRQILGQAGARGGAGLPSMAQQSNDASLQSPDLQEQAPVTEASDGGQDKKALVKQALAMAMLQDMSNGGKNITELKAISDTIDNLYPDDKGKAVPVALKQRQDLSIAGLRAQQDAVQIFQEDPNVVLKGKVTGGLSSRKYDSAVSRAVEGLLRARSGAAVPDSEVKKYIKDYTPRIGDSPEDAMYKLAQLKLDLEDALKNNNNVTSDITVAQP